MTDHSKPAPAPSSSTGGEPFNVNDTVLVRLTEHGRAHLEKIGQSWRLTEGYASAEREDGWSKWQLWDLMHTFGAAMYMGGAVPFETTIRLVLAESPAPTPAPSSSTGGELSTSQKIFVLLAEIRQCINDDHLMTAQRKVMAIETLLKESER